MSDSTSIATKRLHDTLRITRELTPLEIDELVEPERRYKQGGPEPLGAERTASSAPTRCAHARTERIRVMDFKPRPRPR